jgi:uncharacterized membrane protein
MKNLETLGPMAHHKNKRAGVAYLKTKKRYSNNFIAINIVSALFLVGAVCGVHMPGISALCTSLAFIFTFCSLMLPDHEKYTIKEYYTTHRSERRKKIMRDSINKIAFIIILLLFVYGNIWILLDNPTFNYETFMNGFITTIILLSIIGACICICKVASEALIFKKK